MTDSVTQAISLTPPRQLTNGTSNKDDHFVPTWTDTRVGSQNHEQVPSRHAATREWRDGRVSQE